MADTFLSRLKGLLGTDNLSEGEALIITRCQSIHMLFMKYAIDAAFIDKTNRVVGLVKGIKPFRLSPIFFKSSFVIELPCGGINQASLELGDLVEIKNPSA